MLGCSPSGTGSSSRVRAIRVSRPTTQATGKDGKPLTFAEAKEVRLQQREEARIPMAMFTVNTSTGEQSIVHRSTAWLGHLQFSLTDPQLLMFCHEGPWHRVDRIWSMRLGGRSRSSCTSAP